RTLRPTPFPYTTLFRSAWRGHGGPRADRAAAPRDAAAPCRILERRSERRLEHVARFAPARVHDRAVAASAARAPRAVVACPPACRRPAARYVSSAPGG